MILACKNISKSFGTTQILSGVSFHINEKEKVAVVGINGAGKSTLFKIIMGELLPDEGEVIFAKGIRVGYLAQHQDLSSGRTIYEEVLSVKEPILKMEEEIRNIEQQMKQAKGEELERLLNTYTRLTHTFELENGYACRSEVNGVLKGLGFTKEDFEREVSTLSGGQKTRVSLSKLLLSKPELILLDEPTNHLDMESIAWLETFLSGYEGAVIVIAHDRYFLNKVVGKIIELEHTKAQMFEGNYSEYAKKKEQQRETLIRHYFNQQREIHRQEEVIAKLRSFNREKSIKRAESREKMLEKVERLEKPKEPAQGMNIRLDPRIMSGNDVLTIRHLKKSFGARTLFTGLDFELKRGERVALIGNNGTGKTTILKLINGLFLPDAGEIKLGVKVHIGYYDQEHHVLDMEKTIFDELQDTYPHMDNTAIRNTLAAFLFTGDDVFKLIKELSGGERGRVSLAKLMLSEANFLILDEPTNHLDIASKEILENALNSYTGTLLYVSHDRYFINRTATRILELSEQKLFNYLGNYDYYLEKKSERMPLSEPSVSSSKEQRPFAESQKFILNGLKMGTAPSKPSQDSSTPETVSETKATWIQQKEEQAKLRKRQNDLKKLEEQIAFLEEQNRQLDQALADETNFSNPEKLLELTSQKTSLMNQLDNYMDEWSKLAEETT